MPELVSILIPSYNAEHWIAETIESALSQTWDNKEIIIVDDGSTDQTLQIAKKFESTLVKVISQENRGANVARNKALEFAQGDYIQWLDADDVLSPLKIEMQMMARGDCDANTQVLLTSSFGKFYYHRKSAILTPNSLWCDLDPIEWLILKFCDGVYMANMTWLVSRKLTKLAGPWDERLVRDQDGEYFCRVVSKSEKIKFIPEAESYYRQCNPNSISRHLSEKAVESIYLAKALSIGYLRSVEDSERTRTACLAELQRLLYYLEPGQTAILENANALAKELGGELYFPSLNWKYFIIEKAFDWHRVRAAQNGVATIKQLISRKIDKSF